MEELQTFEKYIPDRLTVNLFFLKANALATAHPVCNKEKQRPRISPAVHPRSFYISFSPPSESINNGNIWGVVDKAFTALLKIPVL